MSSFGLRLRKVLRAHVTALIAGVIGGSTGSRCPPLLLLLYRRDDRRCISVVADGAARTARFHDHGLQSGGHVCSGSHSPCAGALSRPTQDEPTTDHADRSPAYQQIIEQLLNDPGSATCISTYPGTRSPSTWRRRVRSRSAWSKSSIDIRTGSCSERLDQREDPQRQL
jgi:hypothetical protein